MERCVPRISTDSSIQLAMSMTSQTEKEFAVVVLTEDGTIVDAHDACKDSLGWNRENLAGQDIGALVPAHRGLLISGILQSSDLHSQLGDEPTFSMRILAQRMDQSSFPARLVVRRFAETDCWTAAFYHTTPLAPPDSAAPSGRQEILSRMHCTPLEEIPEAGPSSRGHSLSGGAVEAPLDETEPSTLFTDEFLEQPPLPEVPTPLCVEQPEAEKDQAVPSPLPPFAPVKSPQELAATAAHAALEPVVANLAVELKQEAITDPEAPGQGENVSAPPAIAPSEHQPEDRRLLEQRVAFLTSQISSLHLELREHLQEQTRTQKKLSTFEEQLQQTKKSLAQATTDFAKQKAEAASGELESTRTLNKVLEEQLALYKSANEALQRTDAEAATQLTALNIELKQTRAALAQETAARNELQRKLTGLDHDRSEQERKSKLEICRLESALKAKELELKQLELAQSI
jgi:hypothetical protein